jgi:hypothetical protein
MAGVWGLARFGLSSRFGDASLSPFTAYPPMVSFGPRALPGRPPSETTIRLWIDIA